MKCLLGVAIRLYWVLIPASSRRRCIFEESCSRYVYRITYEKGGAAGWYALIERIRKCRPGYVVVKNLDKYELHLKDGSIIPEEEMSNHLLPGNIDSIDLLCKKKCNIRKSFNR